jgi:hypothetical protein
MVVGGSGWTPPPSQDIETLASVTISHYLIKVALVVFPELPGYYHLHGEEKGVHKQQAQSQATSKE